MFEFQQQAPLGWKCPCCGRVYAPSVMMCMYCGNAEVTVSSGTQIKINFEGSMCDTTDKKEDSNGQV